VAGASGNLSVRVREAVPGDAPGISRVHVDSWRTTYAGIVPADFLADLSYERREESWRGWLDAGRDERQVYYVAELEGGGIVGFASGGPRVEEDYPEYEGDLYTCYLLREYQGRGLGRRLFGEVARGLRELGFGSVLAWVLAENPACGFYEAVGGERLGSRSLRIGGAELEEAAYGWRDIVMPAALTAAMDQTARQKEQRHERGRVARG
jgi:GNAT superfamily N-acetyltransferase